MNYIKKITYLFLYCTTAILVGCQSAPVQNQYILEPELNQISQSAQKRNTLTISEVTTSNHLYADRMEYMRTTNEVEFFTKSKWAIPPHKMLQDLSVKAFTKTGHYKDVIAQPSDILTNLRLDMTLQNMRQYFMDYQSYVEATLNVRLLNNKTQAILFSKDYSARENSLHLNAPAGVKAYNLLWDTLFTQITRDIIRAQ